MVNFHFLGHYHSWLVHLLILCSAIWCVCITRDYYSWGPIFRPHYRDQLCKWRYLVDICDNEKENWRILTNKEIYARVKKPTITETIRLNRLGWFERIQRMEENRIPKRVLYMNLGTTRLRGRPRSRWQDEVREDGRIAGGEGWQEKAHNIEEWKKLLRTARSRRILLMPMEWN